MSRNTEALVVRVLARTRCGAYLLVRRARTEGSFPGRWELPGGRAETGEPAAVAVKRELAEETGVTCTSEPRLVAEARRNSPGSTPLRELCFVVETVGEPELSGEHDAVSLYRPGSPLPGALTESTASFLRKAA